MAKRFRDDSEASQVLTETATKRLRGELPENEGALEGLAAGKLAVPLPGQHPYLGAPLRPANSAADSPDQQPQPQQWEQQQASPPHHHHHHQQPQQQQQEQQASPQQSPQHWQAQHPQQQVADETALAAAGAAVNWSDPHEVNAYLGWLHHERLRRHGQLQMQQLHLGPT